MIPSVGRTAGSGPIEYTTIYRVYGDHFARMPTLKANPVEFPLRSDRPLPFDPDERTFEDRKRARKIKRRRIIRVTSTLGLIKVRLALTDIGSVCPETLKTACLVSELAYHSPESIQQGRRLRELRKVVFDGFPVVISGSEPDDPQVALWLFKDSNDLFIAFRGQHDLYQVYDALGVGDKSTILESPSTVHESFRKTFMDLEPMVRHVMEGELNRVKRIVVTGHGLGGALATIAAPFLSEIFPHETVQCYTFGAPMTGGRDFNVWFDRMVNRAVRIICSSDPIPFLPLGRPDFSHPIDAICITKSGYTETWSSNVKPSPEVLDGIEKVDLDEWRWEQNCHKYRKRVNEAISRSSRGKATKSFIPASARVHGL